MSSESKTAGLVEARRDGDPQGRIFSRTRSSRGVTVLSFLRHRPATASRSSRKSSRDAKEVFYKYAKTHRRNDRGAAGRSGGLKLHYLRWVLFPIKGDTYFMYQGIFDTDFDKYTEDAVTLFSRSRAFRTVFENLEGFPMDWKTNPASFVKFVRDHQCPSFLEYGGISFC